MSQFAQFDKERLLAARLKQHGAEIFTGVTDLEERKRRMREAIAKVGADVICGRGKDNRPVTYRAYFAQVYEEPLEPAHAVGAKDTERPFERTPPDAPAEVE